MRSGATIYTSATGWPSNVERPRMSADRIIARLGIGRGVVASPVRDLFFCKGFLASVRFSSVGWLPPRLLWVTHAHAAMEEISNLRIELTDALVRSSVLEVPLIQRTVGTFRHAQGRSGRKAFQSKATQRHTT